MATISIAHQAQTLPVTPWLPAYRTSVPGQMTMSLIGSFPKISEGPALRNHHLVEVGRDELV